MPRVAANALLGLHRALIDHVRARALAGVPASVVREDVIEQARRGVARVEAGLADYGVASWPAPGRHGVGRSRDDAGDDAAG